MEYLKQLRKERKKSQRELAAYLGITRQAYSNYETGARSPDYETLLKLGEYFGVSVDELLRGEPDTITMDKLTPEEQALIRTFRRLDPYGRVAVNSIAGCERTRCDDTTDTQVIPLRLSLQSVSAGYGIYLGPEEFDTISVESTPQTRRAGFAVPVSGDSMEPLYHDGDVLLVDPDTDVELGEVGVYTLDGEGYVKKRGETQLLPLNPAYPPVPLTDDVRCNGKVIGTIRL